MMHSWGSYFGHVSKGSGKSKMNRKEKLRELKTKARAIQVRLDLLEIRIGGIRKKASAIFQLKAFVDVEKCVGCGICRKVCPVEAIAIEEIALVDAQTCIGCGCCVHECPKDALSLRSSGLPAQYQTGSWRRANRGVISMFR